jgi:hypothetical protein
VFHVVESRTCAQAPKWWWPSLGQDLAGSVGPSPRSKNSHMKTIGHVLLRTMRTSGIAGRQEVLESQSSMDKEEPQQTL